MAGQSAGQTAVHTSGARAPVVAEPVDFDGRAGPLVSLILWNTIATFLSFGVYRFWARTRIREYFWNHVVILGHHAEYTGRGIELFVGFLLASLIILGATAVFFALSLMGTAMGADPTLVLYWPIPVAYAVLPLALYRARAFRLSRTLWRGLPLGQTGSSLVYAWRWHLWTAASVLTLGFLVPWRAMALERYRLTNTRFGDRFFRFDGQGRALMTAWLPAWVLLAAGVVCLSAVLLWYDLDYRHGAEATVNYPDPTGWQAWLYGTDPGLWTLGAVIAALLFLRPFFAYKTAEFRYVLARTALGAVRFSSDLRVGEVFWPWLIFLGIGLTFMSLGIVSALIIFGAVVTFLNGSTVMMSAADANMLLVVSGLAVLLLVASSFMLAMAFNLLPRLMVIRAACRSVSIRGEEDLAGIMRGAPVQPHFGEGLADALGVGNF